ncbi:D-glycero-alpha-D-manno-heptose 7-phosphate kinase (EC [Olavius algarvensis associated proteobacterium Delta 3]|nr:D-glycero-alpha-D-manno-heptose 7-phosphate kinase (EC [Olavius algarvensis associated proteobacterium Delta 3]
MIISQTPYRVSFAGGGTDLPVFYMQEPGAVLSVGLKHHMYVTVSPRFKESTRVAYTKTEICDAVDDIQHTIVREALRMTGLGKHLEITTIGDVPAGTGLGSSSSLAVGLLSALYAYKGNVTSPSKLAEEACNIEIDILKKPIGRQDQYAAAFGSLNYIRFNPDHTVDVEPVPYRPETLAELEKRTLLLYTQQQRDADKILVQQSAETQKKDKFTVLKAMRDLAGEMRTAISGEGDLDAFAGLLHEGWRLKRSIGCGISNSAIDSWYEAARKAGAQGGKLLGAGGGGFLLLVAPPERHDAIREALGHPQEIAFKIDRRGSRVIFISDRYSF